MGQRLVVNIISNDEILASGYFHWSAYTEAAAAITKLIVKSVFDSEEMAMNRLFYFKDKDSSKKAQKFGAYLMLENTGAGIDIYEPGELDELKKLCKNYNYRVGNNHSDGLIALTPECIDGFSEIAERIIDIDVSVNTVDFRVFDEITQTDIDELINDKIIKEDDIKKINIKDIEYFHFAEIDEWFDKIKEICDDKTFPYYEDQTNPMYFQVIA